ncbi:L-fucose kinase-like [Xenia sp. Carnegie-2017]|uniref:L-fucose kinase-like n=1 Tax=Xenia sp. Carnegie-2017 TaxID=2897299 RepID=UPI001F034BF8|nr:L-fucose kinase-like [Xenia sp. Carnegie-2017]XP_046848618.1 L-fucose kinase-like [Xenia sp. Carnegie-2017]XP_046848620.1 L-fucose kinase-like [Xenia sp. Carnegie-2017]
MNGMHENQWIIAEAPARIDLSGGWSDTPPITYESGGEVTNVAVKVDGIKPIGAKIRKIPKYELILVMCDKRTNHQEILECKKLEDLKDYCEPSASGALLKTAFLCTEVVDMKSELTLAEQLKTKFGCGFEIHSWSYLPFGSGMGTSSILAGTICAAIWRITKREYSERDLIHLVVELEQMLTTGGGWQDQVGGLIPGVKYTKSPAVVPIQVYPEKLTISKDTLKNVSSNMVLIYTGKTRLAKNLLQNVIRRWRDGTEEIINNVNDLKENARTCAKAWSDGDLIAMGKCLNVYRKQKKIMAPDSEPDDIREIINSVLSYSYGCCFAGAGGGGYLLAITKEPDMHKQLEGILKKLSYETNGSYTVHRIEVDNEGLIVHTSQ